MMRRRMMAGQLVVALVVVTGAFALDVAGPDDSSSTKALSPAGGTERSDATSSNGTEGSGSSTSKKSGRVTNGNGSEVIKQSGGSAKNQLPGLRRKKSAKNGALVSRPLPKTASSRGTVVHGFPVTIVPIASGSRVQTSGVSSTATTLQLSVRATNPRSPDRVLAFYRKTLTAHGFAESAVPSVGGSTAASFAHNADNLVVTVTKSRSRGTTYTVFGTLHTGTH